MEKGDRITTPCFIMVRIDEILTREEAREKGFTEPTHYKGDTHDIFGKTIGDNRIIFAAVEKA